MRANHPILKKIIEAYLYEPIKVRHIIKKSSNPEYMIRLSRELMPYRVGIEIDALGYPAEYIQILSKKYGLRYHKSKSIRETKKGLIIDHDFYSESHVCNETRLSFTDYPGLLRFKSALDFFIEKKVGVSENGGLHIHIDLNMDRNKARNEEVAERLNPYFNYIRNRIFKCPNQKTSIRNESIRYDDRAKICVARSHNTIEYRMAEPTFNYTDIIRWVLCCQEFNKAIRRKREPNLELTNIILEL